MPRLPQAVSWGRFVRARHAPAERSDDTSPELEYVISNTAPLPPPAVLMDYELASPGAADRIVSLLEQQVLHQQAIETKRVEAEVAQAKTGKLFSLITRLVAVVSGVALLWSGKNLAGTMAFIMTFAEVVGTSTGKLRQPR